MNVTGPWNERPIDALWRQARATGMSRRRFLVLLAGSGASAVLAACISRVPTPSPIPQPPPSPTLQPSPSPSPSAALPLIIAPVPEQYFLTLGTNAETRLETMASRAYAMPNGLFFVRSHTSTPLIDVRKWQLSIEGDGVERPLKVTYDDLLKMPVRSVTRYVECAGNGRSFFASLLNKPAQGGQWRLGAYGVAEWTGVPLSELLGRAGLKGSAVDVMPTGLDSTGVERPMPVAKAMQSDTIVAYLMNGDILPVDHGFPARVIASGWVGINSIKWVGKIAVSEKPVYVEKNTTSYVMVGPDYQSQPPARGPILSTQVIKSACCLPWPATLSAGLQNVVGYAWSPFGKIATVEVSIDSGKTFRNAALTGPNIESAGSRWEFSFSATPGDFTITPRAADDRGNVQYDASLQKWNEMGYLFGAMVPHPVRVV